MAGQTAPKTAESRIGTPLRQGFTMAPVVPGSHGRDAGRGDDSEDPPAASRRGSADQDDLPRSRLVAEGGPEGPAVGGDGVPLRADAPAAAEARLRVPCEINDLGLSSTPLLRVLRHGGDGGAGAVGP